MTNREKYKQAFSAIKTSCDFSMEEEKMKRIEKKICLRRQSLSWRCAF